jgi:hypothetical protein
MDLQKSTHTHGGTALDLVYPRQRKAIVSVSAIPPHGGAGRGGPKRASASASARAAMYADNHCQLV